MIDFTPIREMFKDVHGRYRTQSLFLEIFYDDAVAIYSLSDEDKERDGKVFPSLRRLYLETADPTEYVFATKYLWGWKHWLALQENGVLMKHIEEWREELEVKLRSEAVKNVLALSKNSYNAAKWAADGSWNTKRGRPSKEELAREKRIRERVTNELAEDSERILHLVKKEGTADA
jgi:hypothetical protein